MKTARVCAMLASLTMLAGCVHPASEATGITAPVVVDLRVRDNADAPYRAVQAFTVPASHEIGDGMMPYEGIGWENGTVGYRLYLDGRLVSDIFGKRVSEPVLANIGQYGSYHDLAPWGMDVLKVGPSLGIGGLGMMRGGQPTQFGSVPELAATIDESGGTAGRFTITGGGIDAGDGRKGAFAARYAILDGSPMTSVSVKSSSGMPLATGIVMHDGVEFWQSPANAAGQWRYIATFGPQSENKDGLGMALFYRADQASYGGLANQTHFVAFTGADFEYGFLAAWERDPLGITDKAGFDALLQQELSKLEGRNQ